MRVQTFDLEPISMEDFAYKIEGSGHVTIVYFGFDVGFIAKRADAWIFALFVDCPHNADKTVGVKTYSELDFDFAKDVYFPARWFTIKRLILNAGFTKLKGRIYDEGPPIPEEEEI